LKKQKYHRTNIDPKATVHTDCGGGWEIQFFNYYVNLSTVTGKSFDASMQSSAKALVRLFNSQTSTTFVKFFMEEMFKNYLPDRKEFLPLVDYLKAHEDDIALSMEDFGDLKSVFEMFIDRKPISDEDKEIMKGL
jgi:hypothetical protein